MYILVMYSFHDTDEGETIIVGSEELVKLQAHYKVYLVSMKALEDGAASAKNEVRCST